MESSIESAPSMNNNSISVITINYNNKAGLEKTIESVVRQSNENFEYIIVDGNSSDGSIDVIEKNQSRISRSIIEKDSGIYDAMNKGIKASTGKYLLFMNSGDWFTSDSTLEEFASFIDEEIDIIYGDLLFIDTPNQTRRSNYPATLSFDYFTRRTLPHQATLIKRSVFETTGLYDTSYKIVSDWGLFCLAICKYQKSYKKVPLLVANFPTDGIGSRSAEERIRERKAFLDTHFKLFVEDYKKLNDLRSSLGVRILNKLFRFH